MSKYNYLIAFTWQVGGTPQIARELMTLPAPIATPKDIHVIEASLIKRITPLVLQRYAKQDMKPKEKTILDKNIKDNLTVSVLIPTLLSSEDAD